MYIRTLVLKEERGKCRQKCCVGINFVSARQGRVGQKCRHLAVGPTCRRHVSNIASQANKRDADMIASSVSDTYLHRNAAHQGFLSQANHVICKGVNYLQLTEFKAATFPILRLKLVVALVNVNDITHALPTHPIRECSFPVHTLFMQVHLKVCAVRCGRCRLPMQP